MPGGSQQLKTHAGPIWLVGAAALASLGAHPMLVALFYVLAVGLKAVGRTTSAIGRALWRGAEPHVAAFGSDAIAELFDRLRRKLRLAPEAEPKPPDTRRG
ncbi:MAG: hypothetical protein ACLP0J_28705 [Solirubrobacteraceae bacterium]